jgi:hypothetical protein
VLDLPYQELLLPSLREFVWIIIAQLLANGRSYRAHSPWQMASLSIYHLEHIPRAQ